MVYLFDLSVVLRDIQEYLTFVMHGLSVLLWVQTDRAAGKATYMMTSDALVNEPLKLYFLLVT